MARSAPICWPCDADVMFPAWAARRVRFRRDIGVTGLAMLALSSLVLLGSGTLALWLSARQVWRSACRAPVRPMPDTARVCLVFGQALDARGAIRPAYAERLARAAWLAQREPDLRFVLLGGMTGVGMLSEAAAGAAQLQRLGVDPARMVLEESSRHTLDNLHRARAVLPAGEPVILLSSRLHLARCAAMAREMGFVAHPCAAEAQTGPLHAYLPTLLFEGGLLMWFHTGRVCGRWLGSREICRRLGSRV